MNKGCVCGFSNNDQMEHRIVITKEEKPITINKSGTIQNIPGRLASYVVTALFPRPCHVPGRG